MKNFLENSEKIFNINFNFKLGKLVHNFKNNDEPFQRWIYYQESFSTELLDWFLKYQKIDKKNSLFLDPFCGSGSSLVSAQKNGIDSIGIYLAPIIHDRIKNVMDMKKDNYSLSSLTINDFLMSVKKFKNSKDLENFLKKI
jgi:DNA modification methylase